MSKRVDGGISPPMSPIEGQSRVDRAAQGAAEMWARGYVDDLRAQGRHIAGGWPGTLSEARVRVRSHLAREGLAAISHEELEVAARAANARARRVWLAFAGREDDDDSETSEVT